jgi:tetratricopeptide (TPR) repeat protein
MFGPRGPSPPFRGWFGVKFWKTLFGGGAQKYEDKADELRLDFEYRDSAYYYKQAIEELDEGDEATDRIRRKLREVRRQALDQLLEEAEELVANNAMRLAQEKLESAAGFVDDEGGRAELTRRIEALGGEVPETIEETPEEISGTEGDLYELALSGLDPEDRERATALGDPFRLGYECCQRADWSAALEHFEKLLESQPEEPLVLELAGTAAENLGEKERALAFLEQSHQASPFRPITVQSMTVIYRALDRDVEARRLLAEAASVRPLAEDLPQPWIEIHLEHALLLSEGGRHDEAINKLLKLIELPGADQGLVFYDLAGVLERMGRIEDARVALEKATEASPRQPIYKERLADFMIKQGEDFDLALRLLIDANQVETTAAAGMFGGSGSKVKISPNRPRYLYKIARVYFLKGEDLEAEKTITTALAISQDAEVTAALEDLRRELKEVRQNG